MFFFVARNSACRVEGEGKDKMEIDVPLKGCGTQQVIMISIFIVVLKYSP